jgi:hypothetical protein
VNTPKAAGKFGVIELEADDAAEFPFAFVATTVTVYAVPGVTPEIEIGLDALVPVMPPGLVVAVYPVIVFPPVLAGAVKVIDKLLGVVLDNVPIVGAPGTVVAVMLFEAEVSNASAEPVEFDAAVALKVYEVPV